MQDRQTLASRYLPSAGANRIRFDGSAFCISASYGPPRYDGKYANVRRAQGARSPQFEATVMKQ
jgi:hypothetical protein